MTPSSDSTRSPKDSVLRAFIVDGLLRTIDLGSLPGCLPYDNRRVMRVRQRMVGLQLLDFLHQLHPPIPKAHWQSWIAERAITLDGQPVNANDRVQTGQHFIHTMPGTIEPEVARQVGIIYEDQSILVVDKPSPMPVHPSGRFNRNTLTELLRPHYPNETLRIGHRLDANTTGIVLLSRTREAAGKVQPQFEGRQVRKEYVAKVHGNVNWHEHDCRLPIAKASNVEFSKVETSEVASTEAVRRGTDTQGARVVHEQGQPAQTRFEVIARDGNASTLVRAIPITGRTNQIRVHLWALGHSIIGDPLYLPGQQLGSKQTLAIDQPPMCLHARSLTILHPQTDRPITFVRPATFESLH